MPHCVNSGSFKKGLIPWNKKPRTELTCPSCSDKFDLADWQVKRGQKYCSKVCADKLKVYKNLFEKCHPNLVPPESRGHSEKTKEKLKVLNRKNAKRGEASPCWKGGLRSERKKAMGSFQYKDWRIAVFKRDKYTCVLCKAKGVYLEADHIKPWCNYPELRYDIDNGRALCKQCHLNQPTHGRKAIKYMENRV
jgi:5-methylcytosine-specific restriction endonuclease McrA